MFLDGKPSRSPAYSMMSRAVLLSSLLLIGALSVSTTPARADDAQRQPDTADAVRVSEGTVQGIIVKGVSEYLGIPYAAAPVGALRWQPPEPPKPWRGIRQASRFGNFCPQSARGVFASPSNTEDCLYLNVYTPKPGDVAGRRPVMVWFYGGGLFSGESNDYDGTRLALRGDTVVVSVNYRIGALGFFSSPELDREGHPAVNYGLMDQQRALRWIQHNIARFGGDPGNVTIFGQSGGGTSVMANLISPTAKDLFQRAINESGTHLDTIPRELARKLSADFARASGCADQNAACLRSLSVETVLKNQAPLIPVISYGFPMIDGTVITMTATEAYRKGAFHRVPIMSGLVHDEQAYFLPETNTGVPLTDADYERFVVNAGKALGATFKPGATEKLQARYALSNYPGPSMAEIDLGDGFKSCTARQLDREWSRYTTLYAYRFDDRSAPSYFRRTSYSMGAYHTSELQYLFPLFHGEQGTPHALDETQSRMSDEMVDYWTNFARTGKPDVGPHKVPA